MKTDKINRVPLGIGWEILWKAWDLIKVNYNLSVLISFFYFLLITLPSVITETVISQIFASLLTPIFCIIFTICSFHWEKGEPYSLTEIFNDLKDKKIMKPLLPVIISHFLLDMAMYYGMTYIVFIYPFIFFCYPILFFNTEMDFKKALLKSFQGFLINFFPGIICGLLWLLLFIICLLCLVLPVIFVALPVGFSSSYLLYRVIFEDLKLESDEKPIL